MPNAVEVVKKAAVEAVEAGKPVHLLFGTVISVSPLKIQVDQKSIYTEKMLILTRNVTDYSFEMTVNHQTELETAHTHSYFDSDTGMGASGSSDRVSEATQHLHAYTGRKTFRVHNALVVGEQVLLARVQQGKKFVVLDRVKGG